jgi:hypothetical protein
MAQQLEMDAFLRQKVSNFVAYILPLLPNNHPRYMDIANLPNQAVGFQLDCLSKAFPDHPGQTQEEAIARNLWGYLELDYNSLSPEYKDKFLRYVQLFAEIKAKIS